MTHRFGGPWSERKLEVIQKYLNAYVDVLKNQNFRTVYIDAFAGTGTHLPSSGRNAQTGQARLPIPFPEHDEEATSDFIKGSARIALETKKPFDHYYFIDKNAKHVEKLRALKMEYPALAKRIHCQHADANEYLRETVSKTDWKRKNIRGVLFADPYGMSVDFDTIRAVASTEAIDVWLLVPIGQALNRMLPNSGEISPEWRQTITRFLGTSDWYDALYKIEPSLQGSLLLTEDDAEQRITKASIQELADYFLNRLREAFPQVLDRGLTLRNSSGMPLFLLCFAVSNPSPAACGTALRIARDIVAKAEAIEDLSHGE